MNLPDMLRAENPTIEVRDLDYARKRSDKWVRVPIGPELAALVEAADVVCDSDSPGASAHDLWRYETARAALVAKIGGSK